MDIKIQKKTLKIFSILLFIALFYTYGFVKHYFDESIWIDGYGYLMGGWWLLEEHDFTERLMKTQAYIPALLIGFYQKLSDPYYAGKLMNYTYMLISIVVLYYLGRSIKDDATGYFAAILFLSIPVIYYLNKRSLVDFPLAVMYGLTSYFYIQYLKNRSKKYAVLTGITAGLTLITKSAGVLIIGIIALHLLITYHKKILKIKEIYYLFGVYILTILPLLIVNMLRFKKPIVAPNSFTAMMFKAQDYLYYLRYDTLSYYASIFVFLLSLYGMYWLWKRNRAIAYYFLTYILIYGFAFSIITFQDPRFFTPVSLVLALLASITLSKIFEGGKVRKAATITLIIVIVSFNVGSGELLTIAKSKAYIGYRELEPYFMKHGNNNSISLVSSEWTLEFVTREFYDNPLERVDNLPKSMEQLKKELEACKQKYDKCYVQIDFWEPTQPAYILAWRNELIKYYKGKESDLFKLPTLQKLESLNLTLSKVVYKNIDIQNKDTKIPVVLLFETK